MDKDNKEEPTVIKCSPTGTPAVYLMTRMQMSPGSDLVIATAGPNVPDPALESTETQLVERSILKVGDGPELIPLNPTGPGKPVALMECPNCAGLYIPITITTAPPMPPIENTFYNRRSQRQNLAPRFSQTRRKTRPKKENVAEEPVVIVPQPEILDEDWTPLPPTPVDVVKKVKFSEGEISQLSKPVETVTTTTAESSLQGQQPPVEMGKIKILQREKKELPSTSQELPSTSQEEEPKSEIQPVPTATEEAKKGKKKGKKKWRPFDLGQAATESDSAGVLPTETASSSGKAPPARGNKKRSSTSGSKKPSGSGQKGHQEEKKPYRGRKRGGRKNKS